MAAFTIVFNLKEHLIRVHFSKPVWVSEPQSSVDRRLRLSSSSEISDHCLMALFFSRITVALEAEPPTKKPRSEPEEEGVKIGKPARLRRRWPGLGPSSSLEIGSTVAVWPTLPEDNKNYEAMFKNNNLTTVLCSDFRKIVIPKSYLDLSEKLVFACPLCDQKLETWPLLHIQDRHLKPFLAENIKKNRSQLKCFKRDCNFPAKNAEDLAMHHLAENGEALTVDLLLWLQSSEVDPSSANDSGLECPAPMPTPLQQNPVNSAKEPSEYSISSCETEGVGETEGQSDGDDEEKSEEGSEEDDGSRSSGSGSGSDSSSTTVYVTTPNLTTEDEDEVVVLCDSKEDKDKDNVIKKLRSDLFDQKKLLKDRTEQQAREKRELETKLETAEEQHKKETQLLQSRVFVFKEAEDQLSRELSKTKDDLKNLQTAHEDAKKESAAVLATKVVTIVDLQEKIS